MTTANVMPVNIRADILRQIDGLAAQQHLQRETFINAVLEEYLSHTPPKPSRDAAFLLSLGGLFDSGGMAISEQVHDIVSEVIIKKYAHKSDSWHRLFVCYC